MTADLAGRVALVTGSASGIGQAIAQTLATRGAATMVHGLDRDRNAAVLAEWRGRGWRCAESGADLGTPEGAARLIDEACNALGQPDILVLNASIELPQTLTDLTVDAMAEQVAVNVTANCHLLQHIVPGMTGRGWGRVIAIGSVQEERPNARHLFYAGTKAAPSNIVLNLARTERAPGVTFNVVRPGAVLTDRNRAILSDEQFSASVVERIPLGRIGTPDDCAGIVSTLCSDAGAYINGAVIAVDGGMRL